MTHAFFKALLFLAAGVVISAAPRTRIFRMGGLAQGASGRLLDISHRRLLAGRPAADHSRLLQQGPHLVECLEFRRRRHRSVGCGSRRRRADVTVHVPHDFPGVLRAGSRLPSRRPAGPRHDDPRLRAGGPVDRRRLRSKRPSQGSSRPRSPRLPEAVAWASPKLIELLRPMRFLVCGLLARLVRLSAQSRHGRRDGSKSRRAGCCTASGSRIGASTGSTIGSSSGRSFGLRA